MSRDDALSAEQVAEQLLADVRRTVKPTRADAARNFAGIEARLGLALGGAPSLRSEVRASGAGADQAALEVSHPELAGTAGRRAASIVGHGLSLSTKGVLVVAFGLAMGVGGYLIGRADAGTQREPLVLDAVPTTSLQSAPSALTPVAQTLPELRPSALTLPVPVVEQPVDVAAVRAEELPPTAPSRRARRSVRPSSPVAAHERNAGGAHAGPPQQTTAEASRAIGPQHPDLHEALELLGRAEAALRRSDGLEARLWLSDLDRRVAPGVLIEERLVTATLASCALGDTAGAQRTLGELERANSESMYRARLEGSCVGDFVRAGDSKVSPVAH